MAATLPQYLVLNGSPILQVGLDSANGLGAPNRDTLQGKKFTEENNFMATKKKAAKKKKKH
jgi:hypothetical protein